MKPIIFALIFLCPLARISASQDAPITSQSLVVMSYNILHGTSPTSTDTLALQASAIREHKPDLVGLQEVDNQCTRSGSVDQAKRLAELTGMHHVYAPHFDFQGGSYGLALLSRFPLTDIRNDRISLYTKEGTTETRALLSATAVLDDGTSIIFATVHMGLNQQTRLVQSEEIVNFLGESTLPTILTGDFNTEPGTPEFEILERSFVDAREPSAHTFPVGKPVKTIDFIMIRRQSNLKTAPCRVLTEVPHSDHYPVLTQIWR